MERFYFNIEDGIDYPDDEGASLQGVKEARHQALRVMAEMLKERPEEFWETDCFRVTVTDQNRLALFSITVSANDAPSLQKSR